MKKRSECVRLYVVSYTTPQGRTVRKWFPAIDDAMHYAACNLARTYGACTIENAFVDSTEGIRFTETKRNPHPHSNYKARYVTRTGRVYDTYLSSLSAATEFIAWRLDAAKDHDVVLFY